MDSSSIRPPLRPAASRLVARHQSSRTIDPAREAVEEQAPLGRIVHTDDKRDGQQQPAPNRNADHLDRPSAEGEHFTAPFLPTLDAMQIAGPLKPGPRVPAPVYQRAASDEHVSLQMDIKV